MSFAEFSGPGVQDGLFGWFSLTLANMGAMNVTIRLFGSVRDEAGLKEVTMEVREDTSVAQLRVLLGEDIPSMDRLGDQLRISVNYELVEESAILAEGDEVALLPPVSGGSVSGRSTVSSERLVLQEVVDRVSGPGAGGIVSFTGAVRNFSKGHEIRHLEYEAYTPMAIAEMDLIITEAEGRWSGSVVALAHRVGELGIGEIAVVVAASAPHRAEAFEAARWSIDELKKRVPIWKKEFAKDGSYWVEDTP